MENYRTPIPLINLPSDSVRSKKVVQFYVTALPKIPFLRLGLNNENHWEITESFIRELDQSGILTQDLTSALRYNYHQSTLRGQDYHIPGAGFVTFREGRPNFGGFSVGYEIGIDRDHLTRLDEIVSPNLYLGCGPINSEIKTDWYGNEFEE